MRWEHEHAARIVRPAGLRAGGHGRHRATLKARSACAASAAVLSAPGAVHTAPASALSPLCCAGGALMNHCDHKTAKGARCRRAGRYYVRHADGQEYRSCASHLAEFVPHKKAKGRPVQPDEELQPETA